MENLCAIFKLFGLTHFIYIFIIIALSVLFVMLLRKLEGNTRKYILVGLIVFIGIFVLLEFAGRVLLGANIAECLPFNQSSIFLYLFIFQMITKKTTWIKFGYFIVLPMTFLSIIFVPNYMMDYGSFSIPVLSYFLSALGLIVYSIINLIWSEEYLSKTDIINSGINFTLVVASVHIYNIFCRFTTLSVHANYFGTMGEGFDLIIGLLSQWIPVPFVCLIPILPVVIGLEFLMYLPFDILKTRRDRKGQLEEIVALGNLKAQAKQRKQGHRTGSQILIRSEEKARPKEQKNVYNVQKSGFVSVNKEIKVNKDKDN